MRCTLMVEVLTMKVLDVCCISFLYFCISVEKNQGQTRCTSVVEVLAVSAGSHRGTAGEGGAPVESPGLDFSLEYFLGGIFFGRIFFF